MKALKFSMYAMVALAAISCTNNVAKIDFTLADAPNQELILKAQDINNYKILDTLTTNKSGKFSCKVDVQKGDPEFFYFYKNNKRVASLLLEAGDKVKVLADTLGEYSVEGSNLSTQMAQILKDQTRVDAQLGSIMDKLQEDNLLELRKEFNKVYIDHYRASVKLAMANCKSMVVIPIVYQKLQKDLPVFGNLNDGILLKSISDSLAQAYPNSKYTKALASDAQNRVNQIELSQRISSAETVGFPDISLKNKKLEDVTLSEVKADCIILHFWNPADAAQKMFNKDVLEPLYKEFHGKGLEIYQVAVTQDRTGWAMSMDDQKLPWINVCETNVSSSSVIALYNLRSLPTTFFISKGVLVDDAPQPNLTSVRKLLKKLLK